MRSVVHDDEVVEQARQLGLRPCRIAIPDEWRCTHELLEPVADGG
jgi:hypothetical protein